MYDEKWKDCPNPQEEDNQNIETDSPAYRGGFTLEPADEASRSALTPPPELSAAPAPTPPPTGGNRRPGWIRTACVALACLLVGAGGTGAYFLNRQGDEAPAVQEETQPADTEALAATERPTVSGNTMSPADIYAMACEQVVVINAKSTNLYGQAQEASGSGFVLSEDGYIITNYHVVSDAIMGGSLQVTLNDGQVYDAEYVGGDSESDVALLKINATGLNAVTLGDSDQMTVGEPVYVVGNPLGVLDYSLTSGLVSALNREIEISPDGYSAITLDMFQIDAAVNSGNSGGPVYNDRGEVIGIVTAKSNESTAEGLGFAIPISDVTAILDDLKTSGYVTGRAFMGISDPQDITAEIVEAYGLPAGVYVSGLVQGGAAEQAGIQAKDIITGLDDTEITSHSQLKKALKGYRAGDTATVHLYRSGQALEVQITFGEKTPSDTTQESEIETSPYRYPETDEGYTIPDNMVPWGGEEIQPDEYFR